MHGMCVNVWFFLTKHLFSLYLSHKSIKTKPSILLSMSANNNVIFFNMCLNIDDKH